MKGKFLPRIIKIKVPSLIVKQYFERGWIVIEIDHGESFYKRSFKRVLTKLTYHKIVFVVPNVARPVMDFFGVPKSNRVLVVITN